MNDFETNNMYNNIGCTCIIKEKGHWRLSHSVKQNWQQTVSQIVQYDASRSRSASGPTV